MRKIILLVTSLLLSLISPVANASDNTLKEFNTALTKTQKFIESSPFTLNYTVEIEDNKGKKKRDSYTIESIDKFKNLILNENGSKSYLIDDKIYIQSGFELEDYEQAVVEKLNLSTDVDFFETEIKYVASSREDVITTMKNGVYDILDNAESTANSSVVTSKKMTKKGDVTTYNFVLKNSSNDYKGKAKDYLNVTTKKGVITLLVQRMCLSGTTCSIYTYKFSEFKEKILPPTGSTINYSRVFEDPDYKVGYDTNRALSIGNYLVRTIFAYKTFNGTENAEISAEDVNSSLSDISNSVLYKNFAPALEITFIGFLENEPRTTACIYLLENDIEKVEVKLSSCSQLGYTYQN